MKKGVVLINPNLIKPPVAPLSLEYLAGALNQRGYLPVIIDLSLINDPLLQLPLILKKLSDIYVIGITLRNIDDASFINANNGFFISEYKKIVDIVKKNTRAPIILGGNAFSISPKAILNFLNVELGICGEGEMSLPQLLDSLNDLGAYPSIPGLIYKNKSNQYIYNRPLFSDLNQFVRERNYINNQFYYEKGAHVGIELSRGCNMTCTYCVEPKIKGTKLRFRSLKLVEDEISQLLRKNIYHIHLCDSEFNLNINYLESFCSMLIENGFNRKLRWYAYGIPYGLNKSLARLLKSSECNGINFGVDSCEDKILKQLGKNYRVQDVIDTARACHSANLPFMFDMLFGAPGETKETILKTINTLKKLSPDKIGATVGIRLYKNTKIAKETVPTNNLNPKVHIWGANKKNKDFLKPIFYSAVHPKEIYDLIWKNCKGDERFLFDFHEKESLSYNYNNHEYLYEKIKEGKRGAFWAIL